MVAPILNALHTHPDLPVEIGAMHTSAAREAVLRPYPEWAHAGLRAALVGKGILSLYSHQRVAADALHAGRDVVVATPTASGKSLCYNLPVLSRLLAERADARALYLFPTKALARDQMAQLEGLLLATGRSDLVVAVYDGDTPPATRRALRESGDLVLTNPHMLHTGILPNHTKWQGLFTALRYVVVDEVHTLSGVYGSHVANVLRRLQRICAHYGSKPVFCAASATISNPGEHARRLLERDVLVVDEDGSARGTKHYVFLNPKLVSPLSGLRLPAIEAARQLGGTLLQSDLQSIFFTRTRNTLEVLLKYLRDEAGRLNVSQDRLAGYRGGYLPELRRKIETGLRQGDIKTVVSTSALELGVDIGSLDVCVLVGYPGTVSSMFQRAGRVGRRNQESLVLFLARSFAMDQYLFGNPGYLFDQPREAVAIDPDNPIILTNHLKCSVFEVPFDRGSGFGEAPHVDEILDFLANDLRVLKREKDRYHYAAQTYPADGISLNAADMDNVVIQERDTRRVLGEVDRPGAITEVYEGAIYGHQGEQYVVEEFDYPNRRAWVKKVDADYYTDAETETEVRVMHLDAQQTFGGYTAHRGEVHVSTLAKAFKKIRFYTRENVGIGEIHLPPEEFETEACMLVIGKDLAAKVGLDKGSEAGALRGVAELIQGLVPLFVRVDPGDVRVMGELKNAHFDAPTITIYDQIPDGVGLSERIFTVHREVLQAALGVLTRCACRLGCPSCIGPSIDQGVLGKGKVAVLLGQMCQLRSTADSSVADRKNAVPGQTHSS